MNIRSFLSLVVLASFLVGATAVLIQRPQPTSQPEPRPGTLRLVLGGDIYAGNRLQTELRNGSADSFVDPFYPAIRGADLHFANLEAPITSRTSTPVEKEYLLRTDPAVVLPLLRAMSVDAVSLANNHVLDYGSAGLLDTMEALGKAGVEHTGAGADRRQATRAARFHRKGRTVALLAFSNTLPRSFWAKENRPGTAYGGYDRVQNRVREVSQDCDVTVVSFHWGSERAYRPKPYQVDLAHRAVRAGADVVFGHHPHSIQPFEQYQGSVIFYSLGNYFFSTLSHDVQYGLVADLLIPPAEGAIQVRFHVLNVNNYQVGYRPRLVRSFSDPFRLGRFFGRRDFARLARVRPVEVSRLRFRP